MGTPCLASTRMLCASTRQDRRSGPIRGGQGRPGDRSPRLGLARPAGNIREVERGLRLVRRWASSNEMFKVLSGDRDFEHALIDGTIIRVHKHGTGATRGGLTTKTVAWSTRWATWRA
jgi:hypothetical protein